jgi:hypothetical protein
MGLTVPDRAVNDPLSPGTMAYAMAQLTPQVTDELAALNMMVNEASATLTAAAKSGSAQKYLDAANALASARSNLAGLGVLGHGGTSLIQGSGEQERMDLLTQTLLNKAGGMHGGLGEAARQINLYITSQSLDPGQAGPSVVKALQEYVHRNGKLVGVAA